MLDNELQIIIQSADIPAVPDVLNRILELADNPNTTSLDLEKIVSQEPSLVSQILKWVNSAFYALPHKVSSVSHAMVLLGFSTVKSIASGLLLINAFNDLPGVSQEFTRKLWMDSIKESHLVKYFCKSEIQTRQDDIFLATMLHHVGHLVLNQYYQRDYDTLLSSRGTYPTIQQEQEKYGLDHAQIGAALLDEWDFPKTVSDMIKHHHTPENYEDNKKDIYYIQLSEFMMQAPDLEKLLSLKETQLTHTAKQLLKDLHLSWPDISQDKDELSQNLQIVEKLFMT